jgi:predicted transposase YbfD/YdcC
MPRRQTRSLQIEHDQEESALAHFEATLKPLPDPRRGQGQRYCLRTVVVTALMAMVCGCDDAEAMQLWGEANADWLETFLDMPHGAPTQDVYLRVFAALDPAAFGSVFRAWARLLVLRLELQGKRHIAVDGKTSRRSFDQATGAKAIHTVSAWMSSAGLVLGQRQTDTKSNEIKAIPELLRVLDIKGATVTIDAMGCQMEIAKTIIDAKGEYLIAVKDNQPTLRADIERTFVEADDDRTRSCDELERPSVEVFEEHDKGHGRIEKRTVRLCRNLGWLTTADRWPGLQFVAEVMRQRTTLSTGETSCETACYIGSDEDVSAADAASNIRRHWGVETKLHWVLDVAFMEDASTPSER